jgi:uncharacterized protein YndB with AHSA1/START domain
MSRLLCALVLVAGSAWADVAPPPRPGGRGSSTQTESTSPLRKSVDVEASAAEVWRAWTTSEGARGFFAPQARIELKLEGAFELYFDPTARPGARGSEGMRVLAYLPERMLAFSWNAPPKFPTARGQRGAWVVVLLEPLAARRTRVTLHHLGFRPEWAPVRAYFDRAWDVVLGRLRKRFKSGSIVWIKG